MTKLLSNVRLLLNFTFLISGATSYADVSLPIPKLIPIRYEVQLQMPTSSDKDPLIPTFFGSLQVEFHLTKTIYSTTPRLLELSSSSSQQQDNVTAMPKQLQKPASAVNNTAISAPTFDDVIELKFFASGLDTFENVTLRTEGKQYSVVDVVMRNDEVSFVVAESYLSSGRYVLDIDRFQGIYYRDAGNLPVLGTDIFFNKAPALFPSLGGPLTKTTTKMTIVHPHNTIALSNMQQLEPTETMNKYWRITRFVQAPNLAAYLLSLAILPSAVYERTIIDTADCPIHVWTNKLLHNPTLKQEIAQLSARVFNALYDIFDEPLPITNLNIIVMNEFNGTHSFGLITLSCEQWEQSDEAHRIAMLAKNFARQWIGGMITISMPDHFCFQEDIIDFLVTKIIKKLLDRKQTERYHLAQYIRISIAENFLSPGESIAHSDLNNAEFHCGLKGSLMLESLETVLGESTITDKVKILLRRYRYRNFHFTQFLDLLKPYIVDKIDLSQIYEFWFKVGGIPNLLVEKNEERLRLSQINRGRKSNVNGHWSLMPFWPLRIAIRNVSLPFTFMLSQVLELAPLDKKLLPLTNVDFSHLYRVNYDSQTWNRILRDLDESLHLLTARTRAQLFGDFCHFASHGLINPGSEMLRHKFLQLLRDHYDHFELCEFYAFACFGLNGGVKGRRINSEKSAKIKYTALAKAKLWPALWNSQNYECGGSGAATEAANHLCMIAFNSTCL